MRTLLLVLACLTAACSGGDDDAVTPPACGDRAVTLSGDVEPIFMARCSGREGCHGLLVSTPRAAYDFFVNQPADECQDGRKLVDPGHPEKSYIIDKLTDHDLCSGSPMPASALAPGAGGWTPLPAEQIQAISDWICAGAKND